MPTWPKDGHDICLDKSGFAILITLKNQPEKWPRLFFYLLGTQKYPGMFLMPFYAQGSLLKSVIWISAKANGGT